MGVDNVDFKGLNFSAQLPQRKPGAIKLAHAKTRRFSLRGGIGFWRAPTINLMPPPAQLFRESQGIVGNAGIPCLVVQLQDFHDFLPSISRALRQTSFVVMSFMHRKCS